MNACVHTYTKPQTPSTRRRGPGWRIHGSVEDTKLSTNKQHTLSLQTAFGDVRRSPGLHRQGAHTHRGMHQPRPRAMGNNLHLSRRQAYRGGVRQSSRTSSIHGHILDENQKPLCIMNELPTDNFLETQEQKAVVAGMKSLPSTNFYAWIDAISTRGSTSGSPSIRGPRRSRGPSSSTLQPPAPREDAPYIRGPSILQPSAAC